MQLILCHFAQWMSWLQFFKILYLVCFDVWLVSKFTIIVNSSCEASSYLFWLYSSYHFETRGGKSN